MGKVKGNEYQPLHFCNLRIKPTSYPKPNISELTFRYSRFRRNQLTPTPVHKSRRVSQLPAVPGHTGKPYLTETA
jgi:hypothetical protein